MEEILDQEKPDFVVHTGDFIDGRSSEPGAVEYYWNYGLQPMIERSISWAVTLGNHDHGNLSRDEISEFDRSYPLSMTQPNAMGDKGKTTNYVLNVLG